MTKILVLGHATVGRTMASGGIRLYHMARVLHDQLPEADVTLAIPRSARSDLDPSEVAFKFERFDGNNLGRLVLDHDVVISTRFPLKLLPLARGRKLVLDLFTPFITEWVEMTKRAPGDSHRRSWIDMKRRDLMMQLAAADVVLVSNERQRDLVAGMMATAGFISNRMLEGDTSLSRLIKIAPIGTRPEPAVAGAPRLRGVVPGIGPNDFVMIWNGIIVDWYDIDLVLEAVARLKNKHPNLRLFFLGTEHPDSAPTRAVGDGVAQRLQGLGGGITKRALQRCKELGLLDTHVFFNFGWANDEDTRQYLLESDMAVCTYYESLETRYSFRVRYLDVYWAGLPLVCTNGDMVADMLGPRGLGIAVAEGDLDALTGAIDRMASDATFRNECRRNMVAMRLEYAWEHTLAPLVEFCRDPSMSITRDSEQLVPLAWHSVDWLASRMYYEARFGLRNRLQRWSEGRRNREAEGTSGTRP